MKKHSIEFNVRYAETDRMGVVYYAGYFIWFEVGRTEYLKSLGLSYREIEEKHDIYLMVAGAECRYKSPATYDDKIKLYTWISSIKNASISFEYEAFVGERLAAAGKTVHVFTDKNYKPTKIPTSFRDKLNVLD